MEELQGSSESILVVEDDQAIRRLIATALRRRGYSVQEAKNGREALEQMRRGQADLVVLDLMMPEVSGWEVLEERMKNPELQRLPVIIVTANQGPELATALQGGICALLPKPFSLEDLETLVKNCLKRAAAESLQPS